ncbi:MAG: hypothetical protein ACR2K4_06350 [Candidatus Limnocylindria bacterium]
MSLFSRHLRSRMDGADDAVERYLAGLESRIVADPLFRRRLRSDSINRFVMAREQLPHESQGHARRHMGRLGRACLYASVTLATTAAGVLGASEQALPGDALYGVKLRIEELRFDIVPAELHAVLAADVIAQRIDEMARLIGSGRSAEARAMAPVIASDIDELVSLEAAGGAAAEARIEANLVVLERMIEDLPISADSAVREAWDRVPGTPSGPNGPRASGGPAGAGPGGPADPAASPAGTSRPKPTVRPKPTPAQGSAQPASPATEPSHPGPGDGGGSEDRGASPVRTARPSPGAKNAP